MSAEPEPGPAPAEPPPWTGPWANDARRLFQMVQTAAEQLGAEPSLAVLRRAGPEVLDRVSELAAGLATALRTLDQEPGRTPDPDPDPGLRPDPDPDSNPGDAPGPANGSNSAAPRPPSTVRIDVTD